MKKETVLSLLKIYANLRTKIGPWLYKRFHKVTIKTTYWDKFKNLDMADFSDILENYEYQWDQYHGLLDNSFDPSEPDYFFQDLKRGRDCDDFARIWRLWCQENNLEAEEYIVTDSRKPLSKAHVITIGTDKFGKTWLFNYSYFGPFASKEEALWFMTDRWYEKEFFLFVKYPYEKEKF